MLLLWLILAHLLGDFPLQGDFIAKYKGKSWYIMLVHCTIWTGLVCIPLAIFRQPHFEVNPARWPLVISCLILTHAAMDTFKCGNLVGDDGWWDRFLLYLDQTFHLLQITFLWWVVK